MNSVRDKNNNLAGVVVLYNPDNDVLLNIQSYIESLSVLYVVDNSESPNDDLVQRIKSFSNSKYIPNGKNLGIATALNIGAREALEDGFNYLFTFDQDSSVTERMIEKMVDYIAKNDCSGIGILSPFQDNKGYIAPPDTHVSKISNIATSGNLLNLEAYKIVGPFLDKLFIDYVDVEYCLRLGSNGYKILRLNCAILKHNLGNIIKRRFLFRFVAVTNHPPTRLYYRTRNRFYVIKKYKFKFPIFSLHNFVRLFLETLKILLFEDNRREKLRMIFKGFNHFRLNKFGRLELN